MTAKELQDEAMDTVVGGSSYMKDLSAFICTGPTGATFFNVSWSSSSSSSTSVSASSGSMCYATSDHGMSKLIKIATKNGQVTLTSPSGAKKSFTAAQLQAMMK